MAIKSKIEQQRIIERIVEKFAPILWLHPNEAYEPKEIGILVNHAKVKRISTDEVINLRDIPVNQRLEKLGSLAGTDWHLDYSHLSLQDGPEAYRDIYQKVLAKNYKTTVYTRVTTQSGKTIVQYWFFYFFNDWHIRFDHEGDWEMIELVFDGENLQKIYEQGMPEFAVYSQHGKLILGIAAGGTKRKWVDVNKLGNHPYVFVGKGSHANYFQATSPVLLDPQSLPEWVDETSMEGIQLIPVELEGIFTRTKTKFVSFGKPVLLPEINDPSVKAISPWLLFQGRWGEWVGEKSPNNGAEAPISHDSWRYPLNWTDSLPWEKGP